mmetsp:Transcript_8456/g.25092  ORF Transcript_8456/g.25092 Transcript_8456/m.25092 type:complete len:362 (-) Transcript_8456:851-1936(-)
MTPSAASIGISSHGGTATASVESLSDDIRPRVVAVRGSAASPAQSSDHRSHSSRCRRSTRFAWDAAPLSCAVIAARRTATASPPPAPPPSLSPPLVSATATECAQPAASASACSASLVGATASGCAPRTIARAATPQASSSVATQQAATMSSEFGWRHAAQIASAGTARSDGRSFSSRKSIGAPELAPPPSAAADDDDAPPACLEAVLRLSHQSVLSLYSSALPPLFLPLSTRSTAPSTPTHAPTARRTASRSNSSSSSSSLSSSSSSSSDAAAAVADLPPRPTVAAGTAAGGVPSDPSASATDISGASGTPNAAAALATSCDATYSPVTMCRSASSDRPSRACCTCPAARRASHHSYSGV